MPDPAPPDPGLPATLGRYKIVAELGRGAMGTVFHGIDATIERPVALKTLNAELPAEILVEVRERFLREAKSAGQLNHPNIVTIYEFGQDGATAFIAMEFLIGKSLQQLMREGRLPFATIVDLVAQIADGLDYAHRFGVVHRDIKPANIMVAPHGLAKITDFGIARVQSSSMTQTGAMLGSPKYMSPEQVLGQPAEGRADIFSLGVVLYEMLAGCTPFETPDITVFSLMQRIVTVPHPSLADVAPGTPPGFDAILTRALTKRAEERYQRASEFAADLRNIKIPDVPVSHAAEIDKTIVLSQSGVGITAPGGASSVPAPGTQAAAGYYEPTVLIASDSRPGPLSASLAAFAPPASSASRAPATLATTEINLRPAAPLLDDFDNLSASLDEMQKKAAADEASAMAALRSNAAKSKDWDMMSNAIASAHPEHAKPPPGALPPEGSASAARRSGVFGLLLQQSGTHLKQQAAATQNAAHTALLGIDAKLRAGYGFLAEFLREANAASPIYAGKHSLPLLGELPPLYFAEGVVNTRMRRTDVVSAGGAYKELLDELILSYNLLAGTPQRKSLNAPEFATFKALLEQHEMKFRMKESRNTAGQIIHAGFEFELRVICAFTMRADITGQAVDINCRNIGPLGRRRYRVPVSMLGDALFEELSKLMLGHPSQMLARQAVAD